MFVMIIIPIRQSKINLSNRVLSGKTMKRVSFEYFPQIQKV